MQKSILQKILACLAHRTVKKYRPLIIGITGSVGKTSTRNAVFAVLKKKFRARTAEKNYNNEIGLPLTILGIPHCGKNIFLWAYWLFRAALPKRNFPEVLVLEYGIDRPGDMDLLPSIARPKIAVVTAIGNIPVHVEFFKGPEELIAEKEKLATAVGAGGHVVLNHDDDAVLGMKRNVGVSVLTYGVEHHADLRITNYSLHFVKSGRVGEIPDGITFRMEYKGALVPFRIHGAFGITQAYAAAAAAGVGIALGMNLSEISLALESLAPLPGRLRVLRGNKHSLIIDDTYNAAPASMRVALEALREIPSARKIAVLGDMKELGKFSEGAHRAVGDLAAQIADVIFCVGASAKFIADEARVRAFGRGGDDSAGVRIETFDDSMSAARALEPLIKEGDLVLVKGSQAMRMERVVEEIMAEPARAAELLVRQERYWKP